MSRYLKSFISLPYDILENLIIYMEIKDIESYIRAFLKTSNSDKIMQYGLKVINTRAVNNTLSAQYNRILKINNYKSIVSITDENKIQHHNNLLMSALYFNEAKLVRDFYDNKFMTIPKHETLKFGHFTSHMNEDYLYNFGIKALCIVIVFADKVVFLRSDETTAILLSNKKTSRANFNRFVKKYIKSQ